MIRTLSVSVAFLALTTCGLPSAAQSQELTVQGPVAHTGYDDLERPLGLTGRVGLPWGGLEVGASWARDESNRRGVPCAGLIPPPSTDCVEQALDVTGTMTTASLRRPIRIVSDRRLLRLGLAAELRGPLSTGGKWGYSGRLYDGFLVSRGSRCVDCFEPFRDDAFETRLSLGITYRWAR